MSVRFEVEQVAMIAMDLPIVLVRRIDAVEFTVGEGATLGDCLVSGFRGIPDSVRADGSPRVNLFAFALVDASDLDRFRQGDEVVLRAAA